MRLRAIARTSLPVCLLFAALSAGTAAAAGPLLCPAPSAATCSDGTLASACQSTATYRAQCPALCDAAVVPAAVCTSEAWYRSVCGRREMDRLERAGEGLTALSATRCGAAIKAAPAVAGVARSVMLPQTTFGDAYARAAAVPGNAACTSGSGACAVLQTRNPRPVRVGTPLTGDLGGRIVGIAAAPAGATLPGQTAAETAHAAWRADGAKVGSCEEYVFHKYEGYSLFEDATVASENDPRAVFTTAFTRLPDADKRARRAIGSLARIEDWRGDLLRGDDLFPTAAQPKNDFLALTYTGPDQITVATQLPRHPRLLDQALTNKIRTRQAEAGFLHRETFRWHAERSDAAARRYSDELLERMAQLRERFRDRVRTRVEVLSQARRCAPPALTDVGAVGAQALLDPIWDPAAGFAPSAAGLAALPMLLAPAAAQVMSGEAGTCSLLFNVPSTVELDAIDRELEEMLHEADRHGCFEPGQTACDWAPSDFQDHVRALFMVERQHDYDACAALAPTAAAFREVFAQTVADEFVVPPTDTTPAPTAAVDGLPCSGAFDYTADPDGVGRYLACTEAYRELAQAGLRNELGAHGAVEGDAANTLVKQSVGDSFDGGNDLFGTRVDYAAGWDLSDLDGEDLCRARGGVTSSATVGVRVLGQSQEVLDVAAELRAAERTRVSVRLLGTELAGYDQPTAVSFNPITGQVGDETTVAAADTVFMVGPFPVRVRAAAAGSAGLDYDMAWHCDAARLGLAGTLRPYAGLSAQASAGVSAVVAEAGIKIGLVLAELSLPLRTFLDAAVTGAGNRGTLGFDTQLDLAARFLDGRAALYAELCYVFDCKSWEYELFSWGGIHSTLPLFRTLFTADLRAVAH